MNAKFTSKVESYIATAAELAQENSHQQLTPVHLAIAIFEDNEGIGKQAAVKSAGEETYKSLLRTLRKRLVRLPAIDPPPDQCYPSKDFASVIKKAQTEQKRRQDAYLGVDVLLLSLINDAEVSAAIAEAGVTKKSIENALKEVRPEVGFEYMMCCPGTQIVDCNRYCRQAACSTVIRTAERNNATSHQAVRCASSRSP